MASNFGTFRRIDYFKITVFGFAQSALWGGLHFIVLPTLLLDFVAASEKSTYLGLLTFAGLMLAIIFQPIAGAISDRSGFGWGRRRPFILVGTLGAIVFLSGISLAGSYLAIFAVYCCLQIASNTAQGPYQAFIPEMVPEGKRGLASGVKNFLDITGGVALLYPISFFMTRYSGGEGGYWLWLSLALLGAVLLAAMLITVLTVKERPGRRVAQPPLLATILQSFKIRVKAHRDFIWFLVSRLFTMMAFTTIQAFALYFLMDVVGVPDPTATTFRFLTVAAAGMLIVVYPAGRLSDRVGRRPVAFSAGLLGALATGLIFLSQQNLTLIMLCSGLVGVAFGAFMSSNWALATDLVPKGEEARYLGLTNLATAGGAALARLIGPLIDFGNSQGHNLGYSFMLGACFIYFIVGALLLLKIRRR
ncbi:MAG: MFS transporter [Dehalococcoidia bacterium]|jgi:Na+/melibiose symporter-like transporter